MKSNRPSIRSVFKRVLNGVGRFLFGLIAFIFCLLMVVQFYQYIVSPWLNYLGSGDWVEVKECVIVNPEDYTWPPKSFVEEFMPFVHYRYSWDGETYLSRRVGFAPGRTWSQHDESRFEWDNKPGTVRSCWVNPEDPSEAVLVREVNRRYFNFSGLMAFLFMCVTGGLGFWLWFGWLVELYFKRPYRKIGYLRGR